MSQMRNTSILASAGTGKTFQLSDRIVKLLALGVKHEEIAALTFTRASSILLLLTLLVSKVVRSSLITIRNFLSQTSQSAGMS